MATRTAPPAGPPCPRYVGCAPYRGTAPLDLWRPSAVPTPPCFPRGPLPFPRREPLGPHPSTHPPGCDGVSARCPLNRRSCVWVLPPAPVPLLLDGSGPAGAPPPAASPRDATEPEAAAEASSPSPSSYDNLGRLPARQITQRQHAHRQHAQGQHVQGPTRGAQLAWAAARAKAAQTQKGPRGGRARLAAGPHKAITPWDGTQGPYAQVIASRCCCAPPSLSS